MCKKKIETLEMMKMFDKVLEKYREDVSDLSERFVCRSTEIAEILSIKNVEVVRTISVIIYRLDLIYDVESHIDRKTVKEKVTRNRKEFQVGDHPLEINNDVLNEYYSEYAKTKRVSEYFVWSKYKTDRGREYDCYFITQKGFTLLLNVYSRKVQFLLNEFMYYKIDNDGLLESEREKVRLLQRGMTYTHQLLGSMYANEWNNTVSWLKEHDKLNETELDNCEKLWQYILGNISAIIAKSNNGVDPGEFKEKTVTQ